MDSLVPYALAVLGGYLLGSIPFGVIVTRMAGLGDVRKIGSGNIGATNVLRTGRKDLALATLIGDGAKGAAAVLIARALMSGGDHDTAETVACVAGGAAFLGHLFPVWLGFKGGKGFATFLGVLLAAAWPVFLLAGATWLLMAWMVRFSSLSALAAAALTPFFVFVTDQEPVAKLYLAVFMGVLVFLRHYENIRRLLNGTEPRIGASKPSAHLSSEAPPGA
jgi:glycerol-3-phosphate acyltransferase PlsY